MATFSNTAREVEMPNGDIVKIHNAPTGGESSTSNIKNFAYDDNGHVTGSSAADADDLPLSSSYTQGTDATITSSASTEDAIAILDKRSDTNKTNILYALDKVGINYVYDYEHGMATPTIMNGVTFTWLDNGKLSIKSNGTNTSDVYYNLEINVGSKYVGKTMSFVGGVASKCAFYISRSSGAVAISTSSADVTIPSDAVNKLFISVAANAGALDIVVEPMIRDSNITSNTYSAPALPNSDLTYLEAEDRAALAEEIDAGAKNKVDIASITTTGSSYVFNQLAINALPAGSYVFSYSSTQADSGDIQLIVENNSATLASVTITSKSGRNAIAFTITDTATKITLYSVRAGTYSNFMLCTKAAFDISSKFVPYRPNWDLVGMLVPKTMYKTVNFSAANTWTYSNLSFTVPAGTIYLLIASISWNSGKPTGICISTTNTSSIGSADILAINEAANNGITCIYQMPSDQNVDKAVYVHVKNESATGSSPVRFTVIRIV